MMRDRRGADDLRAELESVKSVRDQYIAASIAFEKERDDYKKLYDACLAQLELAEQKNGKLFKELEGVQVLLAERVSRCTALKDELSRVQQKYLGSMHAFEVLVETTLRTVRNDGK